MEIVFARGRFLEPGPATVWMRPRVALVEGEEITPLQRVLLAADGGNGVSAPLDWSRFIFINTDLTVHLLRPPEGEWVCLDSVTHVDGIGMTDTALWDERRADRPRGTDLAGASAVVDFRQQRRNRKWLTSRTRTRCYKYIGKLFEQLAEDEELVAQVPEGEHDRPVPVPRARVPDHREADRGRGRPGGLRRDDMEPEVVMTMEADTAHRFWLGKVNVTVALARGQMKAKGPVAKILKLVPLTKPIFPRYRALLEQDGREDLLEAA